MSIQPIYPERRPMIPGKQISLLLLACFSYAFVFSQESARSIIAKSNFIFYGSIVKMNASNISVSASGTTAIVKVEKVIDAVSPYELMEGKEITVLLANVQNKKENISQVFYTTGWYYGKTLGVKEVPNTMAKNFQDGLKEKIVRERINIHNDSLQVELKRAILVIRGVVIESDIKQKENPARESEHNPEYRRAIIQIQTILKGQNSSKQVNVFYSGSDDVMWSNAPKLSRGQEGIFLLQLRQGPSIFPVNGYTVLDKRDVQPAGNLPTVRDLLKKQ